MTTSVILLYELFFSTLNGAKSVQRAKPT